MKQYLGIELGSTRIKAMVLNEKCEPVNTGDYNWKSTFENGVWTYDLEEAWVGLRAALENIGALDSVCAVGVSGMMHGYLAFDKDWKLLTPFRTWQNTITSEAAAILTKKFNFTIPQRWSVAHLYQAVLNKEPHIGEVAHITTLAGYVHYMLTGVNAIGIGEASGMFPIDSSTNNYNEKMLTEFEELTASLPWNIRDLLPKVLVAGESAGSLHAEGSKRLNGLLAEGLPFAPAEGDAGTGMVSTNAVAPRTGNVSAGTSIFTMVVLEKPLKKMYPEINVVTTPAGKTVAMVHANNCTNDMNAWVGILEETANLFGANPSKGELFTKLYEISLNGDADCDDLVVFNNLAGETTTHLNEGRPIVLRTPNTQFTLANFMRAQLYSTLCTLRLGMDLLNEENIPIDNLTGHGGLFKTPVVGQRYLAAACNSPITVMKTAGEGGPYGIALLTAYMAEKSDLSLEEFLHNVFANAEKATLSPNKADVAGFEKYLQNYKNCLAVEKAAIENL